MKKTIFLITCLFISASTFFGFNEQVHAATYSGWQHPDNMAKSCKVRIITDASTYTAKATSVDAKIEQNGKCGDIYYKMYLSYKNGVFIGIGDEQTGSFKSSTPWKSISLKGTSFATQTTSVHVLVSKKKNSGYSKQPVYSKNIKLYAR
ncbi:hypothetical protein ABU952_03250 [Bacillus amyloliquefaciens]|uniref:hypothetical protein n=1 Tax=Bacillus amyloliquefaciens TaxID=1390 RepID=UPI00080C7601|nr:hypothetical protein [Bacillus amyloliquefaciens]OCB99421.1 Cell wall-binding protein YqgA [Bacillus amyloliquefaciens]